MKEEYDKSKNFTVNFFLYCSWYDMRLFLLCILSILGACYSQSEEELGVPVPVTTPRRRKLRERATLRYDEEKEGKMPVDEPYRPDHRDVLFYALGVIARQKEFINDAQDECDRLLEKGYPMKSFSALLDKTEQLLRNTTLEITDMFKFEVSPKNVITPISNATICDLTSKLKKLKQLLSGYKKPSKAEKYFDIIQERLDMAEKELRFLNIEWRSKSFL